MLEVQQQEQEQQVVRREARKRELESECLKCQEEFFSIHKDGRQFNYTKCKRCKVGNEMHELDNKAWSADYMKRDV